MSLGRGTPFDDLFAELTQRMGVLHTATPDTDPSQRDRVEWANDGVKSASRGYRKQGADFVGWLAVRYQVSIYGATELEVVARLGELVGWLDYLAGPEQGASDAGDGYQVGESTPVKGGNGISEGYGCVIPITLYVATYQQIWGSGTVVSVPISVTVDGITGSPELGPPAPARSVP